MAQREKVQQGKAKSRSKKMLHGLLFFIAFFLSEAGVAAEKPVIIVSQHNISYHNEFVEHFKKTFINISPSRKVVDIDLSDKANLNHTHSDIFSSASLIVTVGSEAARLVSESRPTAPVLHTLITISTSKKITHNARCLHKTLYIDQPFERQLALIATALPDRMEIGILLSPESTIELGRLRTIASHYSKQIYSVTIDNNTQLERSLEKIAKRSQLLLTLPDTTVINRRTAKTLIQGAYHRELPVVGFSKSMVKAGALMAVFSTPQQMAEQSAHLVSGMPGKGCRGKSTTEYPRNFSIAINYRVARILGIDLPEEDELVAKLKRMAITK